VSGSSWFFGKIRVSGSSDGGYEAGPRPAAIAVPEPSGRLVVAGLLPLLWMRTRNGEAYNLAG
jgi:hypothetical protein